MRDLNCVNHFRRVDAAVLRYFGNFGDDTCGAFSVPSPIDQAELRVLASSGCGWDHVSVSRKNRCPNWTEMTHIKRLFFEDHETVMELHVPASDHINVHPNCLHLWRPLEGEIPRPPAWMVGPEKNDDQAGKKI